MSRNAAILLGMLAAAILVVLACLASGCSGSLPHRPDTGNHGQGRSPGSACQGQYTQYVETPDGDRFFLECWGANHGK